MKRIKRKFIFLLGCFIIFVLYNEGINNVLIHTSKLTNFVQQLIAYNDPENRVHPSAYRKPENFKSIAYVNRPWWVSNEQNVFQNCDVSKCTITFTNDVTYAQVSDAVILHGVNYYQLFERVKHNQVWILHVMEPPPNAFIYNFKNLQNQINWTMTYRLDSDLPVPYRLVKKIPNKSVQKNYQQILSGKTKMVAWVVSHCWTDSKREYYVKLLNRIVPVDIFGKCGPTAARNDWEDLFPMIEKTYKFYLSFENALCRDYVTEKFFTWQNKSIVPVVRGLGNYSHFYPKGSYIDVNDFKSVTELAKHLLYLDKNDTAYLQYLKAKENFEISHGFPHQSAFCQICERLHNLDKYQKVYKDVYDWYTHGTCTEPPETDEFYFNALIFIFLSCIIYYMYRYYF